MQYVNHPLTKGDLAQVLSVLADGKPKSTADVVYELDTFGGKHRVLAALRTLHGRYMVDQTGIIGWCISQKGKVALKRWEKEHDDSDAF